LIEMLNIVKDSVANGQIDIAGREQDEEKRFGPGLRNSPVEGGA
jgi:hypothetical protein